MAPMVAASDFAFRALLRHYQSADLTFTQMLHAHHLTTGNIFRRHHLDLYEYGHCDCASTDPRQHWLATQQECVYGTTGAAASTRELPTPNVKVPYPQSSVSLSSSPVIAQLSGHDATTVIKAAHVLLDETNGLLHGVDFNLGCPQAIARKGRYGAFLMEQEPELVYQILRGLRQSLPPSCSVSAKIRLPLEEGKPVDNINPRVLEDRIIRLMETGVNFITVHGRTLRENKTAVSACHFDALRRAVETVRRCQQQQQVKMHGAATPSSSCYIIANGGMEHFQDVQDVLRQTGADATMSSEGLLEVPNLFVNPTYPHSMTATQIFQQQVQFCRDYLDICQQYPPLPGVLGMFGSWTTARGHLIKFLHRYLQHDDVLTRDLRDALLLTSLGNRDSSKPGFPLGCYCVADAYHLINELQRRYDGLSQEEWELLPSSRPKASWYRRHWSEGQLQRRLSNDDLSIQNQNVFLMPSSTVLQERKRQIQARIDQLQKDRLAREEVSPSNTPQEDKKGDYITTSAIAA